MVFLMSNTFAQPKRPSLGILPNSEVRRDTVKTAKTWKAQLTILGIAAIVIVGVAMLVFPSVKGNLAGESSRIELTAYFYDPLSPNPASLLQAAIQDAKKPAVANASKAQSGDAKQPAVPATKAAPAGEFQAWYDSDLSHRGGLYGLARKAVSPDSLPRGARFRHDKAARQDAGSDRRGRNPSGDVDIEGRKEKGIGERRRNFPGHRPRRPDRPARHHHAKAG